MSEVQITVLGQREKAMIGNKFGRLTVIKENGRTKDRHILWLCQCSCGTYTEVSGKRLRSGWTRSCGCLQRDITAERNKKNKGIRRVEHRLKDIPEYSVWNSMLTRCNNKNRDNYARYGGRDITVCKRWLTFKNFYADMGKRSEGMTIERIDNNEGYCPENCKWATYKEQMRNTRRTRMITYRNKTQCVTDWAEELGVGSGKLFYRLKLYPVEIALNC